MNLWLFYDNDFKVVLYCVITMTYKIIYYLIISEVFFLINTFNT
jgi:hypothetical protein